ncbi:MAG: MmcQ/YjbR family DNA-binding protein [Geodermatophilaceae bacterium]|nr:MmcQ/YjbR family DNA-binding protein [Geodermatophilaceae bacterium]
MADADDVRRIARGLPAVVEIDSDGFDFRIAGKGFVWSYPERRPGKPRRIRTDIAVLYVGDEAEKQALVLGEPTVFFSTPGYDGWPLVLLRLAEVDVERLAELVTDAWRMRAPVVVTKRGEGFAPGSRRLGSSTASPPPTTSR